MRFAVYLGTLASIMAMTNASDTAGYAASDALASTPIDLFTQTDSESFAYA